MRPQDIVILLKIIAMRERSWYNKDLARDLNISGSEVSESLHRSMIAGLINKKKEQVFKKDLIDFLVHGLKYVFPVRPGRLVRGMPTAYSAPVLNKEFVVDDPYVWAGGDKIQKGVAINPLYSTVPMACKNDALLYDLLSLTDALRIGGGGEQLIKILSNKIYDTID
ncbi:hypothetical protein LQ318_11425 [Aliifodinibius salicampi]|uniref:Winged helix-turn-helix DNA-binding n=1 Tax=Fodinibius salicampi TaxID=1920655 RepID=A0ABT3Q048_9BACT|nr:hypothetical protein [Fodinibius salicampi]MCW9713512.1 hypothetical protein [Fodinibius salicampi]